LTIAEPTKGWGKKGGLVTVQKLEAPFAEGSGDSFNQKKKNQNPGSGAGVTWNCAVDSDISNTEAACDVQWLGGSRLSQAQS
jgi:hypothetical protein